MKQKFILAFGLFFILSISVLSSNQMTNVEASDLGTYEVGTPILNVRSTPSEYGEIVGQLKKGNQLIAFEEKYGWVQTYYDGEEVWVAKHLLISIGNTNNTNVSPPSNSNSLEGYNIVVDPGHGGRDPGAIGIGNILEKDIVLSTSEKVIENLKNAGATVIVTRASDKFVPLNERVMVSNRYFTHAFISLHYDSVPHQSANGVTTYISDSKDNNLANSIQESIISNVPLGDRGVRQADFKVLRETRAPSVLLELGFISNLYDLSIIETEEYQHKVAQGITDGLIKHFE